MKAPPDHLMGSGGSGGGSGHGTGRDQSADHLVELGGGWSLWRWIWLRAPGFSARRVLDLAAPKTAGAADRLLALREEAARRRTAAISALELTLAGRTGPARRPLTKALKRLRQGKIPPASPELEGARTLLRELAEVEAQRARQQDAYERAFAADLQATSRTLRSVAEDPRFREALLWQNRSALYTGVNRLLRKPAGRHNSQDRQHEHLVASYFQRYCLKNDTIGFFGPVASATIMPARTGLDVEPGPTLLAKRTVYFEHWCIDTLARKLARAPELKPHLRPRRMPTVRLDGSTIHYGMDRESEIPLEYARLLEASDGRRTARDIARLALGEDLDLEDEEEVFALLDELAAKRLCTFTLEVPTVTEWPERQLRALLMQAGRDARGPPLEALEELETKRDEVARAAGDPQGLDRALSELEASFERLTSEPATRKEGQTYAGRTLVFEDCLRDLDVRIGTDVVRRLEPPLSLILQSARWYTFRIGELYREVFERAYDDLARESSPVSYLAFWQQLEHHFPRDLSRAPLIQQANGELQQKWIEIASFDPEAGRIDLSAERVASAVEEAFAAPHPGWPGARYHSPDVMIAAPSVQSIRDGGGVFVLGELHPSVCTFHFLAQKELENRAELIRARELDLPEVVPMPVIAKEHASRADHMWVSGHDIDIEIGATRSWRDRDRVVPVSDLVVERRDGRLTVRDRRNRWQFDVVEFFGTHLSASIANDFPMFPLRSHMPRVSLDDVVIARETWRFMPEELEFAFCERGPSQFERARQWARDHSLPRWIFAKIPEEPKPVYVDFESPLYVELLAKQARKASSVTVTEMIPAPDESWLPDAEGGTYTCELRLVAVDPIRWQSPEEKDP